MPFCNVIHLTEDKDVSATRQEIGTDHEDTLGCYQASKTSAYYNEVACEAIANTSKHSNFREKDWLGGSVKLIWDEGDEDFPSGYTLYHVTSSEMQTVGIAFSQFTSLKDNWWKYLADHELADEQSKVSEWETNKLRRIFPPLQLQDVKADD
ncbi:hypothetical protein [Thalassospira lucentensis]|uniref:hypothetical protein n=1 Tax=Thalassospira lucentensis TaxID=168935 RepID=UPI003AA85D0F